MMFALLNPMNLKLMRQEFVSMKVERLKIPAVTCYSEQQYLRTAQEMAELFSDIPEALENTLEIAKRRNLEISFGEYFLPDYPIPQGMTIDEYLISVSKQGLEDINLSLFNSTDDNAEQRLTTYQDRLKFELDIIIQMGFLVIF